MLKIGELPKTCLCEICKYEVNKHNFSKTGLKWDKLICNNCEHKLKRELDSEVQEGYTYGDLIMCSISDFLQRIKNTNEH